MAKAEEIQILVDELFGVTLALERAGEEGRRVLRVLEVGLDGVYKELALKDGRFEPDRWNTLSTDVQQALETRILGALSALKAARADEPSDPKCFMYRAHASNRSVHVLTLLSVVLTAVLLYVIYLFWGDATPGPGEKPKIPAEQHVLRMVILMGALGGTIHWMSSAVNFIGNGNLMRRWIPYYLLAPFQGAALALVVYLILRVGVLSPAGNLESLNLLGLYAFAALTGLFAKQAIEMLRDVFGVVFKKIEAKDASGATKPQASVPAPSGVGTGPTASGGVRQPQGAGAQQAGPSGQPAPAGQAAPGHGRPGPAANRPD